MALVILGHPNFKNSVSNKTIINVLKEKNEEIEIRNISELYPDYNIDVEAEQEAILRHDTIIFQYPFFWYNVPAILKLWIENVFAWGFAHGPEGDKLQGKNFLASYTLASEEESYRAIGYQNFRAFEFFKSLEQMAYYTKLNFIDPLPLYGATTAFGKTENEVINAAEKHSEKLLSIISDLKK